MYTTAPFVHDHWEEVYLISGDLIVVADDQIAREKIDLFPMIVDERRGRVRAGVETQKPRAAAAFLPLVDIAREDLLLDAGG